MVISSGYSCVTLCHIDYCNDLFIALSLATQRAAVMENWK